MNSHPYYGVQCGLLTDHCDWNVTGHSKDGLCVQGSRIGLRVWMVEQLFEESCMMLPFRGERGVRGGEIFSDQARKIR